MRFFRLESPKRADPEEAFGGKGGLFVAGRWNSLGRQVVDASERISLAYLEILAHLEVGHPHGDRILFEIDIPDDLIQECQLESLSVGWDAKPPGPVSRSVGDRWLKEGKSVALLVPSAIIPQERNALINPLHPKFDRGWIQGPVPFQHDARLSGEPKVSTLKPVRKRKLKL